jgi:hypothetical protein
MTPEQRKKRALKAINNALGEISKETGTGTNRRPRLWLEAMNALAVLPRRTALCMKIKSQTGFENGTRVAEMICALR